MGTLLPKRPATENQKSDGKTGGSREGSPHIDRPYGSHARRSSSASGAKPAWYDAGLASFTRRLVRREGCAIAKGDDDAATWSKAFQQDGWLGLVDCGRPRRLGGGRGLRRRHRRDG